MVASRTDEKLILEYVKRIRKAKDSDELRNIDNEITYNDNISVKEYAILMDVIDIKKEALILMDVIDIKREALR